ncbi:MAG: glycine--tRNA ligase subunit beta [Deltaproteobacteria bacterium]|nr:glycine--tRNA ligase subunit beta [Deltaproteobacteria bacterium]
MTESEFILELGTEEIPASSLGLAAGFMKERLERDLKNARLSFKKVEVWAGPRRLALGVWGLSSKQPDVEEEVTGPPLSSAFDSVGNPTRAATGFARGQGVPISEIFTLNTPKGPYLAVRRSLAGKPAGEILTEIVPPLLSSIPFPRSMRWGAGDYSFVRPAHWLLAVLDGEALPLSFAGVKAGKVSRGHRFLFPGEVLVTSPGEYRQRLKESRVLVDFESRREAVEREIEAVLKSSGADLLAVSDPELLDEVANLVEEPAAVLGKFDAAFLDLPLAVSSTAMREHQRYFPVTDGRGRQAPYFVAVNNTRARDMDVVRRGHERVLRARLEDARFYHEEDKKIPLSARLDDLKDVVFHHSLGSYRDKVERVRALASALASEAAPDRKAAAERAAGLLKCDLVTGVVKEFPSLQGVMGKEYALAEGEEPETAEAIREHYLPLRSGGELPRTVAGALLSVSDKLDTICGLASQGLLPTGSADPLALRRQALGVILIILDQSWKISLADYAAKALSFLGSLVKRPEREALQETLKFFEARLKFHLVGRGVSPDAAEAVLALFSAEPLGATQRSLALEALKKREGFRDLAQTFKRVVNIIRKFGEKDFPRDDAVFALEAEKNLLKSVAALEEVSGELAREGKFKELLDKIVLLRAPVDAFFDEVLVDDPDPELKNARIALLNRAANLFELIADFSKVSTAEAQPKNQPA